jgi:AbiU2
MSSSEQIEKLKGHVLIFSEELRALIQSFEVLFLAAEDQRLLRKISGTKRARGFSVVRWSLIQESIIGITKLVYDAQPQNPTAGTLIGAILDPEAEDLREKLKALFAVPIKPGPVPGFPATELDVSFAEEIEKQEVEELKKCFDQYLTELEKACEWFEEHREKFKQLRDKRLAHIDVAKAGEVYELKKAPGPEWRTVKQAIRRLLRITELLLTLLHKKDESFDQFQKLAHKDARDFWCI